MVVAIEARGAPIIPLLLQAFEAAAADDSEAVTDLLQQAATHIQGLGEMLPRMYERCDPHFFYNRIRPFLTGTKASATLPRGVFYEDGEGGGTYHQLGGSSAVQSSLLHFIDIALGIDHYPTGTGPNLPTQLGESKSPEKRATLLEVGILQWHEFSKNSIADMPKGDETTHARPTSPIPTARRKHREHPRLYHRPPSRQLSPNCIQRLPRGSHRFPKQALTNHLAVHNSPISTSPTGAHYSLGI